MTYQISAHISSCAHAVTHLDGLRIQAQPLLLVGHKVLDVLALIALELNHLAHFRVGDDGAIAGKLLLDHFENLLLVEFFRQALHRRQGLAAIALWCAVSCGSCVMCM